MKTPGEKTRQIYSCPHCFAMHKEECVCDENYDGGDDGVAWAGGFSDNH